MSISGTFTGSKTFDYSRDYRQTDCRQHPELYKVGRGEQGVLLVEPYKSELLPHWRFKTVAIATESSNALYSKFCDYKSRHDFVGMDMARKFIQMGYTRARRYCNHKGGRKYAKGPTAKGTTRQELPRSFDAEKAAAAEVFKAKWDLIRQDEEYVQLKAEHRAKYG
eukprot:TRINITY_DN5356_c0_g1_i1.p1 TRINITY_DN5356_c0_g1~~TRINITY_DN5356_c0_g1_i1.p1  ORF type:complete len:166 (-),score=17.38 TRINITY_DN5356_c0_g1_i1:135-632(-)